MIATRTVTRPGERYDHDPRVNPDGRGGFTVTSANGYLYRVTCDPPLGWSIREQSGRTVREAGGGRANNIASADDAIGAIIGDPR